MKAIFAFLTIFVCSHFANAKSIDIFPDGVPARARIFVGATSVSPTVVNTELTAKSLKKMNAVYDMGAEVVFPLLSFFDFGLRYTKHYMSQVEDPSNPSTDYYSTFNQNSFLFIGRINLVQTKLLRFDVFGGYGGSNTSFTIKSASENGSLTRQSDSNWVASPYSAYGASVAVGYNYAYFFVEAGYENNKVGSLDRTGNINSSIDTLNMSGSYVLVGLLFNGMPVRKQ